MNTIVYHAICEDRDFPTSPGTNITPENFERQMEFLNRSFEILSLEKMANAKSRRTVAITFDDGYADNYTTAYPIIKKTAVPVTFFLTVSRVGRDWDFPRSSYPGLSWKQVGEMEKNPLVSFGSHGLRHVDLNRIPLEEAAIEIRKSKMILEEKLSSPISYFSYPHGTFSEEIKKMVRQAGYRAAFSVISNNRDKYSLRRILISRKDTMFRFKLKLSPLYWPLRKLF